MIYLMEGSKHWTDSHRIDLYILDESSACNDNHFSDGCKRRRTHTYVFFYNAAVRTDELFPSVLELQ